jgi:hypothetical protein
MRTLWFAVAGALLAAWPTAAAARIERFAVVIGNNRGHDQDVQLRYAEADAARLHGVLRELGGFEPANMVLLQDGDAAAVTSTLVTVNARIRSVAGSPDVQTMLVVYFSGHADASTLHIGKGSVALREIAQLVQGSAATFRLLIVDACRSGAITTLKGGNVVAPFAVPDEAPLRGEGFAFLTATAADEDAQESDELRGSFFTHALVSGLMGAADRDGDGDIVLDEAYRYAYDATLRATSRTFAGLQHPSYQYDFRGQGDLVLTQPRAFVPQRGSLRFKPGMAYLLMRDDANGPVVAEIAAHANARALSVPPGAYFVRGRGSDFVLEGKVQARAGAATEVDGSGFHRITHARLVRKGGQNAPGSSQGVELGARLRSALPNGDGVCPGPFVGYGIEWQRLGVRARLSACQTGYDNSHLEAQTRAVDADVRVTHAWDFALVAVDIGVGGGAALFHQRFEGSVPVPSRTSLVPFLEVTGGAAVDLGAGYYLTADAAGETYFFELERSPEGTSERAVAFALRSTLGVGRRF